MTEREIKELKLDEIDEEIRSLLLESNKLRKELILLNDDVQRYTETEKEILVDKKSKEIRKVTVGRVHWKENFKDEDTGEILTIERSMNVKIDDKWIVCPTDWIRGRRLEHTLTSF